MVENTVVVFKEALTTEMVEAGEQLTRKLLEAGVPVSIAMWLFDSEIGEWQYVFSSPTASTTLGPRYVYEKVQEARAAIGPLADHVPFFSTSQRFESTSFVKGLRQSMNTGAEVVRLRVKKQPFQGGYLDDALIYRVTP